MTETIKPLSEAEETNLDYTMRKLYGSGFESTDPLTEAKRAGLKEILFEDVETLHSMGERLDGYYIRLRDPQGILTATSANKVYRWVNQGYEPLTELEA